MCKVQECHSLEDARIMQSFHPCFVTLPVSKHFWTIVSAWNVHIYILPFPSPLHALPCLCLLSTWGLLIPLVDISTTFQALRRCLHKLPQSSPWEQQHATTGKWKCSHKQWNRTGQKGCLVHRAGANWEEKRFSSVPLTVPLEPFEVLLTLSRDAQFANENWFSSWLPQAPSVSHWS